MTINKQQIRVDIARRKAMPPFGPNTSIKRIKTINETQCSFTMEVVEELLDELDVISKSEWKLAGELVEAQKRIAELDASKISPAAADVLAERRRHITAEGWTPEHDDQYQRNELLWAATSYALNAIRKFNRIPFDWPWDASWWKPTNPRRDLVKAAALIIAEIERLDRAAGIGKGEA